MLLLPCETRPAASLRDRVFGRVIPWSPRASSAEDRELTPEEKLERSRIRNRDHSRKSRQRKKALVEGMKKQVRLEKGSGSPCLPRPPLLCLAPLLGGGQGREGRESVTQLLPTGLPAVDARMLPSEPGEGHACPVRA